MSIRKIIDYSITLIIFIAFIIAGYLYLQKSKEASYNQLNQIISNASRYNWLNPYSTSKKTPYGFLEGREITTQTKSDTKYIPHFEDENQLKDLGYTNDPKISEENSGTSTWGYIKREEDKSQSIILSYTSHPKTCPCTIIISVFVSDPF